MSAPHKVHWASVAENDLKGIIEYIAEDSLANAISVFEKIKEKALGLNQFPERGRIVPELKDQGIALYRELIVTPWRIIYRIMDKTIYVLSVWTSDAVIKRFENIGEATKNIPEDVKARYPEVPWKEMAGMRDARSAPDCSMTLIAF